MTTFEVGETTASVSIPIIEDTIAELTENFFAVLTIPAAASSQGITKGAANTATISILDNDPLAVVFNPTQYNVNEGDGVVTLTLNADKAASFPYTVEVLTQDGTTTGNFQLLMLFNVPWYTLQSKSFWPNPCNVHTAGLYAISINPNLHREKNRHDGILLHSSHSLVRKTSTSHIMH